MDILEWLLSRKTDIIAQPHIIDFFHILIITQGKGYHTIGFSEFTYKKVRLLCVKELNKDLLVPFTEKLLEKEFIHGKNNSLDEAIFETIKEFEIDETTFNKLNHSIEIKQKVNNEFQEVLSLVTGFPVLFVRQNNQLSKLAGGYASKERLVKKIETIIRWSNTFTNILKKC